MSKESSETSSYSEKKMKEAVKEQIAPDLSGLEHFWETLDKGFEFPSLEQILTREVTPAEFDYLLQRMAPLIVWNSDTIAPADQGVLITLREASPYYRVYDFVVALLATPKKLYDGERTWGDSIQTAQAMGREGARRGWNMHLEGFDKMVTVAWVEVQRINLSRKDKKIQVLHYPTPGEEKIARLLKCFPDDFMRMK
jgi:hypothetical protein